jgi:altronate dehydratase large subunit
LRAPNVGAVVVVALGCEQVVAQHLADAARRHGKPVEIVAIQTEGGTVRATEKGSLLAQTLAGTLSTDERVWCDISELILSLKCGGSDYTSGLASNPTLGRVTDRLVDLGGTAVLGEIAEIMGPSTSSPLARPLQTPRLS